MSSTPPSAREHWLFCVQPNDLFTLEEKRMLLPHVQRREWHTIGYHITRKAFANIPDPELYHRFMEQFPSLSGDILVALPQVLEEGGLRAAYCEIELVAHEHAQLVLEWARTHGHTDRPTTEPGS